MTDFFDGKGKFFTEVISKEIVPVRIQTVTHFIKGNLHVRPDIRVRDMLNSANRYLAVTDASVYNEKGEEVDQCPFLAVNRDHIVWVLPDNDARLIDSEGLE